ncbi:MAG: site-specific integrase [Acidobacteria bacterium]|nr:site-specific integrase [Acidobacteriota bacterium]
MHAQQGLWSPTDHPQVRATLAGIKRQHPYTKSQARPLYLEDLARALDALPNSNRGTRDRAILLVGWWGAFRRSELVGLNTDDLTDDARGVIINLRHSKTDQEGQGRPIPLHYHEEGTCPVRALRSWTGIIEPEGPVFRRIDQWGRVGSRALSEKTVGSVVKEAAVSLGFDPKGFSAHSLRAGFVSECDRRGIPSSAVRLVTGHKSEAMLATYTRPRNLFESSAGAFF